MPAKFNSQWRYCVKILFICMLTGVSYSFAPAAVVPSKSITDTRHFSVANDDNHDERHNANNYKRNEIATLAKASALTFILSLGILNGANADTIGVETEAPTLFTGETVLICTKRGPLGACTKTEQRTAENDNDKASKYFKDPSESLKEKYNASQLQSIQTSDEPDSANALIEKLKKQSEDNKERNDSIVRQKTLQNDLGASFGPFDRQVVILNSDGDSYTLLTGPQAMRLKKAGYIKDRRFVTQPTQSVIDEAAEAPDDDAAAKVRGVLKGIFGDDK